MYDCPGLLLAEPTLDAAAKARLALVRVGKLLSDYLPGMSAEARRLREALEGVPTTSESRLALGWLGWLEGEWERAETTLAICEFPKPAASASERGGEDPSLALAAGTSRSPLLDPAWLPYWLARVRLLQGKHDALATYEAAMKQLAGSPQATAWYVDLLWRAGRSDRAEQVWKSVRGNKRVLGCDEAPLLEARIAIRKGEHMAAERLLRESSPRSGVVVVERALLLTWILAAQRKADLALDALQRAGEGPYPLRVLNEWRLCLEKRLRGESLAAHVAPGWQPFLDAQQARAEGRFDEATGHYRSALAIPAVQPFAAHALACLAEGAAPQGAPGLFLGVRARVLQATERFCRREGRPAELLEALDQAGRAGLEVEPFAAYRQLARQAQDGATTIAGDGAVRRNSMRLAVEACQRLGVEERLALLTAWAPQAELYDLRGAVGMELVRTALVQRDPAVLELARGLVDADWLQSMQELFVGNPQSDNPEDMDLSLRQALRLMEAARQLDLARVTTILEDQDAWRSFRAGPPRFVLAALEALVQARPTHSGWARALPGWLGLWPLGERATTLLSLAGLVAGQAPAGVAEEVWYPHQAARALLRDDAATAVEFLRRVKDAPLPAVERLAQASALARALGYEQPGILTDFVDLLQKHPAGPPVLTAATRGEAALVQTHLGALGERADVPARLLHHLALVETRLAHKASDPLLATLHGRRAWNAWLGFLGGLEAAGRSLLLEHLLSWHRDRINDHLSREELGPARSHWQLVMQLPGVAATRAATLVDDLKNEVERFRDDLGTRYLLSTREAMRFGDIPEGWRADYERGLASLRRLLALDRDNVRLLTAYVETCGEWFFDLYHLQAERLFAEVERLLEPAERLHELVCDDDKAGAARSALADYWKFRGFAARDREAKRALYHEALRLNPGNTNVRDLLAGMEKDDE